MKLRPLSFRELIKILKKPGFVIVRQRGNHMLFLKVCTKE